MRDAAKIAFGIAGGFLLIIVIGVVWFSLATQHPTHTDVFGQPIKTPAQPTTAHWTPGQNCENSAYYSPDNGINVYSCAAPSPAAAGTQPDTSATPPPLPPSQNTRSLCGRGYTYVGNDGRIHQCP